LATAFFVTAGWMVAFGWWLADNVTHASGPRGTDATWIATVWLTASGVAGGTSLFMARSAGQALVTAVLVPPLLAFALVAYFVIVFTAS
jgi:hypothetical protein